MREGREIVAALGVKPKPAQLSAAVDLAQRLHPACGAGGAQRQSLDGADVRAVVAVVIRSEGESHRGSAARAVQCRRPVASL